MTSNIKGLTLVSSQGAIFSTPLSLPRQIFTYNSGVLGIWVPDLSELTIYEHLFVHWSP